VVNFWARPPDCSEEVWAELEDKMVKEIGDDEEFKALQDQDGAYIVGWFAGVLAAHKEDVTRWPSLRAIAAALNERGFR
jgi:hypothetical protein